MRENPGVKKSAGYLGFFCRSDRGGSGVKTGFLLISGDLFHAQPLKKELREVNYLFSRIPQTKIILMAGNHDYLRTKSYYLTMEWEENVYFFRQEEPGHFDFEEENVSIYGLSYWHREMENRFTIQSFRRIGRRSTFFWYMAEICSIFHTIRSIFWKMGLIILLPDIFTKADSRYRGVQ